MLKYHKDEAIGARVLPAEGAAYVHENMDDAFDDYDDFAVDPNRIDVDSIIALTARLSHVLAQEVDYLNDMQVGKVADLQKEKLVLLDALEAQKRFMDRNHNLLGDIGDDEALQLAQIIEIFQNVLKENHHKLLVAREVNTTVVGAISDALRDASRAGIYDETGRTELAHKTISMNLNQTI